LKKGLLAFLLLTLAGCNKDPIEIRHQPDIPTPDQWSVANVDNSAIRSEWWEAFGYERLDDLVGKALDSNYDLRDRILLACRSQEPRVKSSVERSSHRESHSTFLGKPICGGNFLRENRPQFPTTKRQKQNSGRLGCHWSLRQARPGLQSWKDFSRWNWRRERSRVTPQPRSGYEAATKGVYSRRWI
jgi:hypothetical protein